jgi:hypothetical protein
MKAGTVHNLGTIALDPPASRGPDQEVRLPLSRLASDNILVRAGAKTLL